MSADVTGKAHITFLFFFLPGEPDLVRINDDDEIARVHMWRKNGFLFATEQIGRFYRDTAEYLILGVNNPPLAWHFGCFCGKRFHGRKKSTKTTGDGTVCQPKRHMESCQEIAKCSLANSVLRA